MMEAVSFSETSVTVSQSTWYHTPEDLNFQHTYLCMYCLCIQHTYLCMYCLFNETVSSTDYTECH